MKLTLYTDYSLRVLIYLGSYNEDKLSNIKEIAEAYNISKNHLMKVIHELGKLGYIETLRGRNGGIRLAMEPETINIGAVVRKTEDDFHIVECFSEEKNRCVITPVCGRNMFCLKRCRRILQCLTAIRSLTYLTNKDMLRALLNPDASFKQ